MVEAQRNGKMIGAGMENGEWFAAFLGHETDFLHCLVGISGSRVFATVIDRVVRWRDEIRWRGEKRVVILLVFRVLEKASRHQSLADLHRANSRIPSLVSLTHLTSLPHVFHLCSPCLAGHLRYRSSSTTIY